MWMDESLRREQTPEEGRQGLQFRTERIQMLWTRAADGIRGDAVVGVLISDNSEILMLVNQSRRDAVD